MFLGSLRANIIWKLVWNDSGVILKLLEIDPESFFNVKVYILSISPDINSQNEKNSKSNFKSQHLVINPGQGPPLKCAPGHESMEDFNIIKSYWPKSGVVQIKNWHVLFLYLLCSTSTAMNAITIFPRNSFLAFNQSPILQVSRIGYMPEMGFSSHPVNKFLGSWVVSFMAVDVERHKRIPRECVCNHSKKVKCLCWD